MEWERSQGLEVVFIKIDFSKAYDRVEWPFIVAMLKTLWVYPLFVKVVETLFSKDIAFLSIKKAMYEETGLFSSVKERKKGMLPLTYLI
uniref:Reverse transcriptase domain-containing protein n=1 Tax=Picea glauca TaxID=3330 RepID=A0A117NHK7_PICGL|nr:hypothetical protein ABT39_MTgene4558 [Picea glauca]QHR87126.1 hypothetical protein Q903MT_gene1135 [Picea sitchensis]